MKSLYPRPITASIAMTMTYGMNVSKNITTVMIAAKLAELHSVEIM